MGKKGWIGDYPDVWYKYADRECEVCHGRGHVPTFSVVPEGSADIVEETPGAICECFNWCEAAADGWVLD